MFSEQLFAGRPKLTGGLTNEKELLLLCPEKFKSCNIWSSYADFLFLIGGNIANWSWKSTNTQIQDYQLYYFKSLLRTHTLQYKERKAIAGWMLSEMLSEVPIFIPIEQPNKL